MMLNNNVNPAIIYAIYEHIHPKDYNIVLTIISQESNFNPTVKSKTGDHGLMQINKIWNPDMNKVYQTRYNICFAYDRILLPMINKSNNVKEIFARYNGSKKNVNKYMKKLNMLEGV